MEEQKIKYKCQKLRGRVGKKKGMDISTLNSLSAIADKQNALSKVDTSRNSMLFKTLCKIILVYSIINVQILPLYLEKI